MSRQSTTSRATVMTALHEYRACEELWVQAITNQTVARDQYDVIVVDAVGHPTFNKILEHICPDGANVTYERIPLHGRARALNHALAIAKAHLVIFLADDFVPGPDFIESHLRFHRENPEPEALGIGAGFVPFDLGTEFTDWLEHTGRFFGIPFFAEMTAVPEDYFYVGNASVKRELVDRAGTFDEIFLYHAGDDFEFGQRLRRAGMRAQLVRNARASHPHSVTLNDRMEAYRELGRNARAVAERAGQDSLLKRLKLSHPLWWSRVVTARISLMVTNTPAAQRRFWSRKLDAAFAEGYRQGQNGNQPN